MRVKLTVAYDGTNYHGYQSQVNGASVQDVLEEAIEGLFGQKIRTMGASRTDAGVHAEGNVAVFDVETRMDPTKICYALNSRLPQDVRIMDSCQVIPVRWRIHFTRGFRRRSRPTGIIS